MKRILVLCLFAMIFFFGSNVYAAKVAYYLSNNEMGYNYYNKENAKTFTVNRGDYIYVYAVIDNENNSYSLKSGKTTIRWDETAFELVKLDNNYYKKMDYGINVSTPTVSNNKISLNFTANSNLLMQKSKLLLFKFGVLNSASMGTYKIYQMDDEDTLSCYDATNPSTATFNCANSYYTEIKYKVEGSDNNNLSNITLDGVSINNFAYYTKKYSINTDKNKVVIAATKQDDHAKISGDIGEKNLDYGVNTFKINVESESGKTTTYTLDITRIDNRSKVNTLKSLEISDVVVNFKEDVLIYDFTVKNEIKKVTVKATLKDNKATMSEDYTNKEISLSEGVNKISIKVTAENGDEKTYVINITRELSGNNTLKEITVNKKKIDLKENVFNYSIDVESDISSVSINATASEKTSLVDIQKPDLLEEGENDVKIIVTAPNGNEVTYHITVNRKPQLSSDALLKSLEIKGYDFKLKNDKFYYDLKIKNEESLDIVAVAEEEKAQVTIEGNKELINGSIIKINVKAEDGTITRYFINIEKDTTNWGLIITIGCLLVILVLIIIKIIKTKKKQENRKMEKAFVENHVQKELKKESDDKEDNDLEKVKEEAKVDKDNEESEVEKEQEEMKESKEEEKAKEKDEEEKKPDKVDNKEEKKENSKNK